MRIFLHDGQIINVDNDQDAARVLSDPLTTRELSDQEVSDIFGDLAHVAGPGNTTIDENGAVVFTPPAQFVDVVAWIDHSVRPERDQRLQMSDKYMISDYPITEAVRTEWTTYRQALRDLPGTLTVIVDPIPWPSEPA